MKWILCAVDEDSSHFSDGPFYVSWYEGKKKQMESVGRYPELALRKTILKRTALAFIAVGTSLGGALLFHRLHLLFVHSTAMHLRLGQSAVNFFQVFRG